MERVLILKMCHRKPLKYESMGLLIDLVFRMPLHSKQNPPPKTSIASISRHRTSVLRDGPPSFAPYFDWRKLIELSCIVKRSGACVRTSNSKN